MKPILKLYGLLALLVIHATGFAQSDAQKRVLVYFKTGVQRNAPPNQNTVTITSSNVTQVLNNYSLNSSNVTSAFPNFNEADTVNSEIGENSRQMNYAKVFAISLPDTSFKSSIINSLLNLSEVLYAESDGDVSSSIIPIDPQFGQQWNMRNTIVPGADIHLDGATNIFTGNPNAVIAIIDAGIDVSHDDLAAKINGGDNGFLIQTDPFVGNFSHGSHVAGIAAAVSNNNNNNGVAGVDWQATIHSRYVIGNNSGDAGIAQGINAALNFGPDVWTFNHSWGLIFGFDAFGNPIPGRYSVTVRSAFANVYRNNRVACVAMGNHQIYSGGVYANEVAFPAGFNTGSIAVGATDINDEIGDFSANGPHIDVSAPGVNILSTNFNNGYVVLSGTSMAAPHVSGLASLLKGFNTALDNDDIEQIIRLTADDANAANGFPGFDNQMGTGRINAERALQSLQAPNQLFHWNVTGGTIFNTSGNETKIFLGVPGFADAAYIVRRSEVRTDVVFPTSMCNMIGAWGRGVGTTGYREEQGRSFGEGICEVVPGTLTNTGATLRTWIYEVWGINGQYYGFYPRTANNVIFQYTVLGVPAPSAINGDDAVCGSSSNLYTIPNLPVGATVQWQVTPSGIVTVDCPTCPQTTLTKITNGTITLTAIISNVCGLPGTIQISRQITITNSPTQYTLTANYSTTGWSGYLSYINCLKTYTFPGMWSGDISLSDQVATSYAWTFVSKTPSNATVSISYTDPRYATVTAKPEGAKVTYRLTTSNACGSYSHDYRFDANGNFCGVDPEGSMFDDPIYLSVSPNPSSDEIKIRLTEKEKTGNNYSINQIKILDKMGQIKKLIAGNKQSSMTINISQLPIDIYMVMAYDGKQWRTAQLMKK
jgi:hypothetical protein